MPSGSVWRIDRTAYNRLFLLPGAGWAWEFKRRDPVLWRARRLASAVQARTDRRADGSTIYRLFQRCHVAEQFGLHFIPDPALSAFEIAPFWLPEVLSASFDVVIESETRMKSRAQYLRWDQIPGEKHFLITPGRRDKLVVRLPGYAAQLALDDEGFAAPQSVHFSLKLGAGQLAGENFRHVEDFARVYCGLGPACKPSRGLAPEKLRDAIIAVDGALAGVPRRRIAEAIFGAERVRDGWDEGDESYKKRTKRLVEKGFALVRTGYRKLL